MLLKSLANRSAAALAGCAMLGLSLSPASALTIPAPGALIDKAAHAQVDNVRWRRWGWGPGAVLGGLAAGAIIGSAIAPHYYGYGYGPSYAYGPGYYEGPDDYYGAGDYCWRRVAGPYGWHWAQVC